jgi:HSP90 family molecular chaperone
LNVSREILQKNKILQNIQRKLVRKVLALFQDLADGEDTETWYVRAFVFRTNE